MDFARPFAVAPERIIKLYRIMDKRARNWAFIAYPESLPDGWMDTLSDYHIPAFISPLHNQDCNLEGEKKKEHYHIMLMFQGKKSLEQVKMITDSLNATIPQMVSDLRGYARYLIHLDETDDKKYHYEQKDVISLAGACYEDVIQLPNDTEEIIKQIEMHIAENDVTYYADYSLWLANNKPEWHKVFRSHTIHFSTIFRSIEYKGKVNGKGGKQL